MTAFVAGFEPATFRLRIGGSAAELHADTVKLHQASSRINAANPSLAKQLSRFTMQDMPLRLSLQLIWQLWVALLEMLPKTSK